MTKNSFLALCFFTAFIICIYNCCKTTGSDVSHGTYLNLQDSVKYVGMATCRSCHNQVHETFIETGMGRSFHLATREKSDAIFDEHALVYDTLNDLFYFPYFDKKDELNVLEFRLENGDTIHKRLEKINYIVGSGQHTNSHIIDINGYVYQAPVTWYTQEKRWDLAPGYRENNSRFGRWLTDECITCHNHYPTPVPGSLHKFRDMPTGIECERCHGPGEIHATEMLAGNFVDTATTIDYTIVNPKDLSRDRQMDLCQRCHLQGVAVTEPGKSFFDFKPGMRLQEVMNVFLPRYTDSHEKFIMASQADRLQLSECFKNAEELTCITCHHPHHSIEVTPKEKYNNACKNCHAENSEAGAKCTAPLAKRESNDDDCSACHMPKSGSIDIPHVRITDHFIASPKKQSSPNLQPSKTFLGIEILTKKNATPLDMARGYLATHDKYIPSPVMLDSAGYYLQSSKAGISEKLPALIHYLFLREDHGAILQEATKLPANQLPDAWTAYRIGEAYLRMNDFLNALKYFETANKKLPFHLDFAEKKGIALMSLKRIKEAKAVFGEILAENPKRPVALCNLGFCHVLTGNTVKGMELYNEAIALDPDYEQALVNKAALLIFQKKQEEGKKLLERVLEVNPENEQAKNGLLQL